MSWLYSIVFAGLAFSSGDDAVKSFDQLPAAPPAAVVQGDERERFEQSYPLSPNGRVNVGNVNGSIVVEAWDRPEVRLEAVKIADTKEALADVQLKIESRADSFSVEADYDTWRRDRSGDKGWKNHGKLEVQFKLSVPRGAVLDEIETVNGSVNVSNFVNITKISAVNGNVAATNLRGTANLSTVNGAVTSDFDRLEAGSRISLSTVNGSVNLIIPSDANATLKADSLNGEIRNDFGLPVRKGKYVGRDMYGRIGSGEVQIRLESVNGPLTVQRKNDGKSPSPSVNLLPQKAKDDEDWDGDTSWNSKTDKINRDIARAVRDSARTATEGMEVAQAELVRIAPEIEKIRVESLRNVQNIRIEPKIKIDQNKIHKKQNDGRLKQSESLERLQNIKWSGGAAFIEKKSGTFAVKGTPRLNVEAKGSAVKVRGWDRNEVKYVLTEIEGQKGRSPVSVDATATDSSVSLKVNNNERVSRDFFFDGANDAVRIEVFVPRRANMKIVSNGEIRLDGVSGDIELVGVDEAIDVRDVGGKLKITAADSLVRIIGFTGELDSRTGDGDVYLEGDFTKINGNARDGSFILTVPENYNADITSNVQELTAENMEVPEAVKEGTWRLGAGGRKLNFTFTDEGEVRLRNANSLTSSR